MAKPPIIHVKESNKDLKLLQKGTPKCYDRIQMLILIKEGMIASKEALADELGVSSKSVHVWRTKYQQGGDVMLAVECKATKMEKSIFREVLGFRREIHRRTR